MYGAPFAARDFVQGGRTMTAEIGGRDRFKFFKRPVVPTIEGTTQTQVPLALSAHRPTIQRAMPLPARPQLFLPSASDGARVLPGAHSLLGPSQRPRTLEQLAHAAAVVSAPRVPRARDEPPPATRDVECQTMYRENETQTDPTSPDYYLEEGQHPECLAIMELKWGEGLPAGLGEVEMIDRVRRRKEVEANLPQGNDNASMQLRLAQLETLEKAEWEEREAHIRQLQEQRLVRIGEAIQTREAKREEASKTRVEKLKASRLEEVEAQLRKLQERRHAITRKLTVKHSNPCQETEHRDIIKAHTFHGSRAKPVASSALVEKINATNYDVRPTLLSFAEGVDELEKHRAPKLEAIKEEKLLPPREVAISALSTNYQKRQAHQVVDHLEYAQSIIDESKRVKTHQSSVQDLYRATPRLQRPDTPTLVLHGDDEEESEEAVLLLQRLLRGRAIQNDFFEGKERCHGLILELQAAQNAKANEHLWMDEREAEAFEARQEVAIDHVVDEALGDVIHGTLDYLFKELLRQQEAAKVERLRMHAIATREEREKIELARREAEVQLREREERQYALVIEAMDAAAETFLEQTMRHAAIAAAEEQALQEQLRPAQDAPVGTAQEREEEVCRLLDEFVVPYVCAQLKDPAEAERRKALAEVSMWAALSMTTTGAV